MSILKAKLRPVRLVHWAFALLAVSLAGCVLLDAFDPAAKPFGFSHRVHVVDQGLDCADCHRNGEKSDDPGMPSAAQCALCHEELDAEKPEDHKVKTLFDGKKYRAKHFSALADEIVYSHKSHATRGLECAACHAEIVKNDVLTKELAPTMDSCTNCHAQKAVSNDCAVCHTEIRADVKPPNHGASWKKNHGPIVRECRREMANRCDLCHKDTSCTECHMTELPENHKGYWRRRGHGLAASRDRESCATCHQASTCDDCHRETKPLDHNSGFGSPTDRHCVSCHEPLANENCVVCHTSTPSHALATPKPPGHNPAMNCRMCHGNGQPLPHPDNGDNCNSCHN